MATSAAQMATFFRTIDSRWLYHAKHARGAPRFDRWRNGLEPVLPRLRLKLVLRLDDCRDVDRGSTLSPGLRNGIGCRQSHCGKVVAQEIDPA